MRILFVNTYYYPNMFGGAEKSVKLLATFFSKKYPCAVFSADASIKGLKKENIDGVVIYRSGSSCFNFMARFTKSESRFCKVKNRLADLYNPAACRHFKKVLDEFQPDIIHTNGVRGISPLVWKIAQKCGIKVIHTLRDYYAADPLMREEPPKSLILSVWQKYWNKKSKYINAITAPSSFVIKKMSSFGFGNKAVLRAIPNGIVFDKNYFSNIINRPQKSDARKIRFLFVGTLVDFKGVLKLLSAFKEVQKKREDVELVFCGAGPLAELIQEESKRNESVIYRGKLDASAISKEYQDADVCVIPSLWEEPFGLVVIEAAYNGCALIASNKGGIPEIIDNLNAGILCDCSNVQSLAQSMLFLCDEEERNSQRKTFAGTAENFSIENCINQYNNLYTEVLNG